MMGTRDFRAISIGINCQAAHQIRRRFGYKDAFYFDWLIVDPEHVPKLIQNGFEDAFLAPNLHYRTRPYRHVLDEAYNLKIIHDFDLRADFMDKYELVKQKYNYLAEKWKREIVDSARRRLLFVAHDYSYQGVLDACSAIDAAVLNNDWHILWTVSDSRDSEFYHPRVVRMGVRQPDPYVWTGCDRAWDHAFDAALEAFGSV